MHKRYIPTASHLPSRTPMHVLSEAHATSALPNCSYEPKVSSSLQTPEVLGSKKYKNVDLKVFVHYPQQLMRSFHKPVFRSKIAFTRNSDGEYSFWRKLLKITIGKVSILRKRPESNVGCNEKLVNDDAELQENLIKHINCTPPYWRRHYLPQENCKSKADLQRANMFIQHYRNILNSYTSPCIQMEVLSMFDREEENEWDDPRIMFVYENREYEEIQNTQSFDLESFVSGIGGFIGIFLGYSILQIPELLVSLTSFIITLKENAKTGEIY